MELIECIKTRRSVRNFTGEPVADETLKEIVELALYSPSWKNTSTPRYTVIKNPDIIKNIATNGLMEFAYNQKTLSHCQTLTVVSYKTGRCGFERDGTFSTSKGDRWQMFDAGVAAETFCLAAWEKGVGSVIMGIFDEKIVAEIIGLPETEEVACLIAMGYSETVPPTPPRKAPEEVMRILD